MKPQEIELLARAVGGRIILLSSDGNGFELKIEVQNHNPKFYNEPFIIIKFTDFGWEIMKSEN